MQQVYQQKLSEGELVKPDGEPKTMAGAKVWQMPQLPSHQLKPFSVSPAKQGRRRRISGIKGPPRTPRRHPSQFPTTGPSDVFPSPCLFVLSALHRPGKCTDKRPELHRGLGASV